MLHAFTLKHFYIVSTTFTKIDDEYLSPNRTRSYQGRGKVESSVTLLSAATARRQIQESPKNSNSWMLLLARSFRLKIICVLLRRKLTTRAKLSGDVMPCLRLLLD